MDASQRRKLEQSRYRLTGQRIYLREVCPDDVDATYHRWMNDPVITRYLEQWGVRYSMDVLREYVEKLHGKEDEIFFAVCLQGDGHHIGNIKIGPVHAYHKRARVGLIIGEQQYWGRGYATEAIGLVADFGFEVLGLNKIEAGCHKENLGSRRAFERAGFSVEGELRDHLVLDGELTSEICLGIVRKAWLDRRAGGSR